MNDLQLAKMITEALERAEIEAENNIYILKPDVIKKVSILESLLQQDAPVIDFDLATNSIELSLTGYVFDSCICDLKRIFNIVDLFVIDSMVDGKVCIEMKILNAAEITRRDKNV